MAISDQLQMLISAFIFGSLFQASINTLLRYLNGNGSAIFEDHRRLVLVLFLASVALWAQIDFVNFAVPSTSPNACQATIIASTFFDQAGRVMLSGFLLWSIGHVKKTPVENSGLCLLMALRTVVGIIFIAYTRPQFAPVCIARSDLLAASVSVVMLDMITVGVLVIRMFTLGLFDAIREVRPSTNQEQSKALGYCTAGLFLWTLASSAMMVGMPPIALLLRTAVPAIGLMILVLVLTFYTGALILPRIDDSITPEARSPFVAPLARITNRINGDDGSPICEAGYTRTANLFVVNPSNTPHDSSVMTYLEDVKAEDDNYTGYRATGVRVAATENKDCAIAKGVDNSRASGGIFHSLSAATLEAIGSAGFLATPRQAPVPSSTNRAEQTRALSATTEVSDTEARQKRPRFGWSRKSANRRVHKIVISDPVMDDRESVSSQPFARMRTVDLATAAASERERRDGANSRQLVATRPAPPPPTASEALRKNSSTRRKELPTGQFAPLILKMSEKTSDVSKLSVAVNGSSTSASLSPGYEDVRRRSPRSVKALEGDIEKAFLFASRPNTIVFPKGGNPETVMYVNDIIYDHPGIVNSIIEEVPTASRKSKSEHCKTMTKPLGSLKSPPEPVMQRPRPYRRDLEKDNVIFASESSPLHKRSNSSPSTRGTTTAQRSNAGITSMAPITRKPTTAAGLKKLFPDDAGSMTVDEKISLLFPAPPVLHHTHSRRSSVPSLPRIPSGINLGDFFTEMLTDEELRDRRVSKRTTISFGSQIQNDGITPTMETPMVNEHGIYRFSADAYRTVVGYPRDSRMPELPCDVRHIEQSDFNRKVSQTISSQRSSMITSSSSDINGSGAESKSAWASIHSPIPAIDLTTTQQTARETYISIRKDAQAKVGEDVSNIFYTSSPIVEDENDVVGESNAIMTVMFSPGDVAILPPKVPSILSSPSPSPTIPDIEISPLGSHAWHKRIGDELPAFSQNRRDLRSRAMPPPYPLVLSSHGQYSQVDVHEVVADKEAHSTESALEEIQAQLRKLDGATEDSLDSLMHSRPEDSPKSTATVRDDRKDLLANLEMEMGQQETLWMQMQHNFDRDSNSTIMTPQVAECTPRALPSPPSETSSPRHPRIVNRRPRIRSKGHESTTNGFARSPGNSKPSIWQQRLAEAEINFKENAPPMLGVGSVDVNMISKSQLGSPTPPESLGSESDRETKMDYDTDEDSFEMEIKVASASRETNLKSLWEPKLSVPRVKARHLWIPTCDISDSRTSPCEPAAKELRPIQRRDLQTLFIVSWELWSKPVAAASRPSVGLWGSKKTLPRNIGIRPKAQRPQRKARRATFLPDILENPSPLPQKLDTLGIFRFPWGEKSDSAVYNPVLASSRASRSPYVPNTNLGSKLSQLESEPAEYSSSFFDEYEDDYEGESEVNSDEDFDESTLWEIANLLNSEDVPSLNSLFPCPRIIEDYDNDDEFELGVTDNIVNNDHLTRSSTWPETIKFISVQPVKPLTPLPMSQQSDDWEQTQVPVGRDVSPVANSTWQVYLPALDDAVRGKPYNDVDQDFESRSTVDAGELCDKALGAVPRPPVEKNVALWTHQINGEAKKSLFTLGCKESLQAALWTAPESCRVKQATESFKAGTQYENCYTTCQAPPAFTTSRKLRVETLRLPISSSQQLWAPAIKPPSQCHWITLCSNLAKNLSFCPTSPSSRSSRSSDEKRIALTATKESFPTSLDQENPVDPIKYDPATRHPVFFTTDMASCASFLHPAAIGYVIQLTMSSAEAKEASQLWLPSLATAVEAPRTVPLWAKPFLANGKSNVIVQQATEDFARWKTKDLPPLILPVASSTTFWHPVTSRSLPPPRHWLHDTAVRTATATPAEQSPLSMLLANTFLEESPSFGRSRMVSKMDLRY